MKVNKPPKYRKPKMEHWQVVNLGLMLYDVLAVNLAFFLALWLRFDCSISTMLGEQLHYTIAYLKFAPIYTVICILVFWRMRLYKSIWRLQVIQNFYVSVWQQL